MNVQMLCEALRASRGFAHKRAIDGVVRRMAPALAAEVAVGDDCAAIKDGDGYLLLAIEGLVDEFVEAMPWFAGYCSVMVNVSDIYAMGGRPVAVVDALWSKGRGAADAVIAGMTDAACRYAVPIVGGHTNDLSRGGQLAVAILGRARRLLTSFAARPGDALVMAVDLRGQWQDPYPYWNASTEAPDARLRGDLAILPALAESGLCDAAKDISMAGALGTALMLLESSGVGGHIDVDAIPRPDDVRAGDDAGLLRWLTAFPSYGFVLSVRPQHGAAVLERFRERDIACAVVGESLAGSRVGLRHGGFDASLWDFAEQAFIGGGAKGEASA